MKPTTVRIKVKAVEQGAQTRLGTELSAGEGVLVTIREERER